MLLFFRRMSRALVNCTLCSCRYNLVWLKSISQYRFLFPPFINDSFVTLHYFIRYVRYFICFNLKLVIFHSVVKKNVESWYDWTFNFDIKILISLVLASRTNGKKNLCNLNSINFPIDPYSPSLIQTEQTYSFSSGLFSQS